MTPPSTIHPTAIIESGARISAGCQIGPYCHIGAHVALESGCRLQSHVVLDGHLSVGPECEFFSFACIGKKTQDLKYKGEVSYVTIGARNVIREYVTIHAATQGGGSTRVGSDCLIQSYCHIAHECQLGNKVIMSSGAMLAGHVEVGNGAVIGGLAGVAQFVKIGDIAMIGGYSKLTHDVLPFTIADGMPAVMRAVNKIGMERNGKSAAAIKMATHAFRTILKSDLTLEQAAEELQAEYPDDEDMQVILRFLARADRGLARPRKNARN